MLNKAQVIGYIGRDPKITVLDNGRGTVASFSVATTEKGYTAKNGRRIADRTEWHNIVCFGRIADVVKAYLRKGSKVFIEGKMRTRQYDDENGVKRSIMEINAESLEMLDSKPATQTQQTTQQSPYMGQQTPQYPPQPREPDLPF